MSGDLIPKDKQILNELMKVMSIQSDRISTVELEVKEVQDHMKQVELIVETQTFINSRERKQLNKAAKTKVMEQLKGDEEYREKSRKYSLGYGMKFNQNSELIHTTIYRMFNLKRQ